MPQQRAHSTKRFAHQVVALILCVLLTGCGGPTLTYADVVATAHVTGCWPDPWPTPNAVPAADVQPIGATATHAADVPTATPLPTITPYPRCAPAPGATQIPWPARFPTSPPFPTMASAAWQGGSDERLSMHLPGHIYGVDLAVHPTEGWPAVIAMSRFVDSTDPMQVFARVYDPNTRTWNVTQQVDIGASSAGQDRFGGAAIGITGDRTVIAAWGSSDADGSNWASTSADFGRTWTAPTRIGTGCWFPLDITTTVDNQVAVLLSCWDSYPGFVTRTSDGRWQPMEIDRATRGQFGAIRIVGTAADATAVAVLTELRNTAVVDIYRKRLADGGAWEVRTRTIPRPLGLPLPLHWQQRAVVFAREGDPRSGIAVTWPGFEAGVAYALVSRDGGATWGEVETIVALPDARITRVVPAYDPAADRLVAIWTCCGRGGAEATQYASWSVPAQGRWVPTIADVGIDAVPLVLGARAADDMAADQARNSRTIWLAWAENEHQLEVRSFDLNKIVPIDQYPQPTTTPAPTAPGGQP